MIGEVPLCLECERFVDDLDNWHCPAFPEGIPDEIIMGFDHRKEFPGDKGIRFLPKKGE
jgi:hypothetical protein